MLPRTLREPRSHGDQSGLHHTNPPARGQRPLRPSHKGLFSAPFVFRVLPREPRDFRAFLTCSTGAEHQVGRKGGWMKSTSGASCRRGN